MSESFIYLWYDAPNKKYYLGKHKGSPDDTYTHSSTIWESSTKDNIPEGVTRRILAYGTDEEMCILEHKLLVNRKKRCWDRYYNESLGDPRYVDMSGENNHFYGKTHTEEVRKKLSEINSGEKHPQFKHGRFTGSGGDKEIARINMKKYRQTSEYKEWLKEYEQRPERIASKRETGRKRIRPAEYKAWKKVYDAERYARKKAERYGEGTLDKFLK